MQAASLNLPCLRLGQYRFRFRTVNAVSLPNYTGSAWRGVFGRSLKKLVCVTREPQCESCLLYRHCIYPYVFETPPAPDVGKLRRYTAAPHPFVLSPGDTLHGQLAANTEHTLDVTLFGHGNRHLPYIIHALDQAGRQGIGKQRSALVLFEVQQRVGDDWCSIYRPGENLNSYPAESFTPPGCPMRFTIRLLTPLRIKAHGRLVSPDNFTFKALFSALLRRISLLTAFHADTPLETDFSGLSRAAETIPVAGCDLRWHEWTRYSSRQHSLMQLGGLLGTITVESSDCSPFWPYIWLGQWTHAGKNATMGLGRYQIIDTD